jgi:hypothetical protein
VQQLNKVIMDKLNKKIFLFIMPLIALSAFVGYYFFNRGIGGEINVVRAGACGDNDLKGYAWSENIGWISFSSNNCDSDGNTFLDVVCGGDNSSTPITPYSVSVDNSTGKFSGYAWSENIGWISFSRKTCAAGANAGSGCFTDSECPGSSCSYDGPGATGTPPQGPYNGTEDFIAFWDKEGTGKVYGWAKILSLGDDGWIKLGDTSSPSWNNQVSIDSNTNEFIGWAWNGNNITDTGIGWISFNHLNCDPDDDNLSEGDPGCPPLNDPITEYKVEFWNQPPTVTNLKAPNLSYDQVCSIDDARRVQLTWEFNDTDILGCNDYMSAYQIIVDDQNHTQAELDSLTDAGGTGLPLVTDQLSVPSPPTPVESFFPTSNDFRSVALDYDTPYYWWVKVWDSYGASSGWVQYDSPTDTDNDDGDDLTFTTYAHEFPDPYFSWFILDPSQGEQVLFSDLNSGYYTGDFSTRQPCADSTCGWLWSTSTPIDVVIGDETSSSTIITFNTKDPNQEIIMTLTENTPEGYYCSTSTIINPNVPLPTWKEVKY